jgi:hypothetical protein
MSKGRRKLVSLDNIVSRWKELGALTGVLAVREGTCRTGSIHRVLEDM